MEQLSEDQETNITTAPYRTSQIEHLELLTSKMRKFCATKKASLPTLVKSTTPASYNVSNPCCLPRKTQLEHPKNVARMSGLCGFDFQMRFTPESCALLHILTSKNVASPSFFGGYDFPICFMFPTRVRHRFSHPPIHLLYLSTIRSVTHAHLSLDTASSLGQKFGFISKLPLTNLFHSQHLCLVNICF